MEFKIRAFGRLAEAAGNEIHVAAVSDSETLRVLLRDLYPVFREVPFRISVNHRLIVGAVPLTPKDEIAVLPPFSGG